MRMLFMLCFTIALLLSGRAAPAQDALPADAMARIDAAATSVLNGTGAPSASIAIVKDGRIVYTHAYGLARLEPKTPATPAMRYSIGSVSKQFTASALLLLAQEHKLSLDDPVGRWLPELTRAREVTVRHLLSMTSGYQDYWPQDYVMPPMLQPTTAADILQTWARKPLDFDPGTRWQYSNTNYVIAGLIVERITGAPLLEFLKARIFTPLGMKTVSDIDSAPLGPAEPERYRRFALGPPRPAPKEGKGWLFAAGELAMTAEDLAIFQRQTGRITPLLNGSKETYLIIGRRGGKSFISALITCFIDFKPFITVGETLVVMCLARDKEQARIVFRYVKAILNYIPALRSMIVDQRTDEIELTTGLTK